MSDPSNLGLLDEAATVRTHYFSSHFDRNVKDSFLQSKNLPHELHHMIVEHLIGGPSAHVMRLEEYDNSDQEFPEKKGNRAEPVNKTTNPPSHQKEYFLTAPDWPYWTLADGDPPQWLAQKQPSMYVETQQLRIREPEGCSYIWPWGNHLTMAVRSPPFMTLPLPETERHDDPEWLKIMVLDKNDVVCFLDGNLIDNEAGHHRGILRLDEAVVSLDQAVLSSRFPVLANLRRVGFVMDCAEMLKDNDQVKNEVLNHVTWAPAHFQYLHTIYIFWTNVKGKKGELNWGVLPDDQDPSRERLTVRDGYWYEFGDESERPSDQYDDQGNGLSFVDYPNGPGPNELLGSLVMSKMMTHEKALQWVTGSTEDNDDLDLPIDCPQSVNPNLQNGSASSPVPTWWYNGPIKQVRLEMDELEGEKRADNGRCREEKTRVGKVTRSV